MLRPLLEIHNLKKRFGNAGEFSLDDLSFKLRAGEIRANHWRARTAARGYRRFGAHSRG
ncbi:hypothetical protein HUU40_22140 [candidate division KSB1 bacterium]|nr:hypothetical protein [candidate division KSB1 bacterium]